MILLTSLFVLLQLTSSADISSAATFTRGALGETCRPAGQKSGGYCAVGNLDAFTSADECLERCEAWDACVCGVAWSRTPGHYFCHLFTGSNSAPSSETCQSVLKAKAYPGLYQPYGRLTCGSTFEFAPMSGFTLTESTLRDNFEFNEGCTASSCTGCRVRRSWAQMDANARKVYTSTVTGISLGTHGAALKNRYTTLVNLHQQQFGTQIHRGPVFFPWHRWFILQLENLLREVEPCITVPYWAWEMDAANPKIWTNDYPLWGGDNFKVGSVTPGASKFSGACIPDGPFGPGWTKTDGTCGARSQSGGVEDMADIQTFINTYSSSQMWGFFDKMDGVHGQVHCSVGGDMCNSNSAQMPEFYMHHGNIDRIWAKWQARGLAFQNAWSTTYKDRRNRAVLHHDGFTLDDVMPGVHDGATARQYANLAALGTDQVCVQYEDIVGGLSRRNLAGNPHHAYDTVSGIVNNLPQDADFWGSLSHVTDLTIDEQAMWVFNQLQHLPEMDPETAMELVEEGIFNRSAYIANRTYDDSYDPSKVTPGCEAFSRISGATCASVEDVLQSNPEWTEFTHGFTETVSQLNDFVTPGASRFSAGICEPEDSHHFVISKDCSAYNMATCDNLCKSQAGCVAFTIDVNGCCTTHATKPSAESVIEDECCECFIMDSSPTAAPSPQPTAAPKCDVKFSLRGTSGLEQVRIQAGEQTQEIVLKTTNLDFTIAAPSSGFYEITYLNDLTWHDVIFTSNTAVKRIEAPEEPSQWKCGQSDEDVRCQYVRDGRFAWSMTYRIYIANCGFEPTDSPTPASTAAPSVAPTASPRTDVCFAWGDPHVSSFHPISQVNGLWNVYDRFYGTVGWESYFRLEQDNGDVFEVKAQHEDLQGNGLTFIVHFQVLINNKEVLDFIAQNTTPNPPQQMQAAIIDPSQVTIGATGTWPSGSGLAMPHAYSFPNWSEVEIFFNYWSSRRVDMGILFAGPGGVPGRNARATGLCCTESSCPNRSKKTTRRMLSSLNPNPRASLPISAAPVCPTQQTCCANFAQHDVLYKSCLVDSLQSCCAIGADETTCCTDNVAKCGVDYECEDSQTCTDAGFCVQDEPGMCKGEWGAFSECSATCGTGIQSRQYRVLTAATAMGADCPSQDGEIETRSCTRGRCGDVCEGIICASAPICMSSVGICEDASSRFNGVRVHECVYDPLPKGTSCAFGTCNGEGECISPNSEATIKSESNGEEMFDLESLVVGAGIASVLAAIIALSWCVCCKESDNTLDTMWDIKDAPSLSMQVTNINGDLEDKPSKHL